MRVYIDGDRHGIDLATKLSTYLSQDHDVVIRDELIGIPYPVVAYNLAIKVIDDDKGSVGILVCKTGIGMAIVSNKVDGVFAANCHTVQEAIDFRQVNNGNLLCLGSNRLKLRLALDICEAFLNTSFLESNRHSIELVESLFVRN